MATQQNEFLDWKDGAPVINMSPDKEFLDWKEGAPVVDVDESNASLPEPPRRRVFIF